MLRHTALLALFGMFCSLTACAQSPAPVEPAEPLDFETDARILRGVWTGEDERGHRLLIDANASAPNNRGYAVTGTFQLDDAEPVVIEGGVRAPMASTPESLSAQTSPATAPFTAVSFEGGWRLEGDAPAGSPPRFRVVLSRADESYTFTMTTPAPTALNGTEWTLTTLRGGPLVEGSNITLDFGEHNYDGFGGYSGCNWYGARYLATETTFSIVYGVGSTAMLCGSPAGVMEQEEAYGSALGDVTTYRVTDNRLEMADEGGDTVLTFTKETLLPMDPADLAGTKWQLQSVNDEHLTPDAQIMLAFPEAGKFVAAADCVAYSGTYDAEDEDIHVTMMSATYDDCGDDEMLKGQEGAFSDYLSTATDYQVSERELRLFTDPGDILVFTVQP